MMPAIDIVKDVAGFEALRPAWSDLLQRSATKEPTLDPAWMLAWWRVFGPLGGRRLRIVTVHEGARLVGIAPLLLRTHWYLPGLPYRRLELLGSGEPQEDEICSDYIGIVAEKGAERAVVGALVRALFDRGAFDEWDELVMPSMAGDGVIPALLAEALRERGVETALETTNHCPYIPLPKSFDAYLSALSSSRRSWLNRTLRDVEKLGSVELRCAKTRDELARGRKILESLHAERWSEGGDGGGVFGSRRFCAFHDEVMPVLFDRGALDLLWLEVNGEPIAALYNIVWNQKTYFYQSGRRLEVPKNVRPGIAIHALAIKRAIELGHGEYDFLAGESQYKLKLALDRRPLVRLRAVLSAVRETARRISSEALRHVASLRNELRARIASRIADDS